MDFHKIDLESYLAAIRDNKFLPNPPDSRIFTGGGDFRQNGIDTVRQLVVQGHLKSNSRVLEIGSGIGRVALPLTQMLQNGSYTGTDIVLSGIAWCHEYIEQVYENFKFLHFDIYNEFYNPTGRGTVADVGLPFDDNSFDLVFLTSVFTHLDLDDATAYLSEIKRVLSPEGRLWGTWFVVDSSIGEAILDGRSRVELHWTSGDGVYYTNENRGTLAVAYDEQLLRSMLEKAGLKAPVISRGEWITGRGHIDGGFQDAVTCVA